MLELTNSLGTKKCKLGSDETQGANLSLGFGSAFSTFLYLQDIELVFDIILRERHLIWFRLSRLQWWNPCNEFSDVLDSPNQPLRMVELASVIVVCVEVCASSAHCFVFLFVLRSHRVAESMWQENWCLLMSELF